MRSIVCVAAFLLVAESANAFTVAWNCFKASNGEVIVSDTGEMAKGGSLSLNQSRLSGSGYDAFAELSYSYSLNRSGSQIQTVNPNLWMMPAAGEVTWVVMMANEVLSASTFDDASRLFLELDEANPAGIVGSGLSVSNGKSYYLGVRTGAYGPDETYQTLYGWVEMIIAGDTVSLGDSVLGLDMDTFVVGADYSSYDWTVTPEPTGGTLLLFGVAVLALRRKKAALVGRKISA